MAGPLIADRVKETTTTTGTGTVTLLGAAAGYVGFGDVFADGDTCYYVIVAQTPGEWETGIGTVGGSGTTLARTTPMRGSSGDTTLVSFSAGTKEVFIDWPSWATDRQRLTLASFGAAASFMTALTGTHNDLVWTAYARGEYGNTISIAYEDPEDVNQPLTIVQNNVVEFTIKLATNGSGTITSTADDVASAMSSYIQVVSAANAPGNDGSGVVTAMAQTFLTGGLSSLIVKGASSFDDGAMTTDGFGGLTLQSHLTLGAGATIIFPSGFFEFDDGTGDFYAVHLLTRENGNGLLLTTNDPTITAYDENVTDVDLFLAAQGAGVVRLLSSLVGRIVKRVQSVTDAATVTANADTNDAVDVTALAQACTLANPTGTPTNFQGLTFRFKDNGTARALTWGTAFVPGGTALPTTTVLSKILTVGFIYNTANALNKWQCVASAQET